MNRDEMDECVQKRILIEKLDGRPKKCRRPGESIASGKSRQEGLEIVVVATAKRDAPVTAAAASARRSAVLPPSFYGVQATGRDVAFLVDVSGNMDGPLTERLKREFRDAINGLPPDAHDPPTDRRPQNGGQHHAVAD
jgi:hypothetical protein